MRTVEQMDHDIDELQRTMWGPNRDDGIMVEHKVMLQFVTDAKRLLFAVLTGVMVDLVATIIAASAVVKAINR